MQASVQDSSENKSEMSLACDSPLYILANQKRQRNSRQRARNKREKGAASGGKSGGGDGASEGGGGAGEFPTSPEEQAPTGKALLNGGLCYVTVCVWVGGY